MTFLLTCVGRFIDAIRRKPAPEYGYDPKQNLLEPTHFRPSHGPSLKRSGCSIVEFPGFKGRDLATFIGTREKKKYIIVCQDGGTGPGVCLANVDQAAVFLLESLPAKHRAHLIRANAEHYAARASVREKLEVIVARLGPRDIMPYQNLYFDHNPRLFVWYLSKEDATELPTFYNSIVRRYGVNVRTGLEPELEEDGPAELHRILDRQRTLVLEFGMRDRTKLVFHAWREKRYRQDSIYRVVVNAAPLTLEVRATGAETQNKLVIATGKTLARNLDNIVRCDLSPSGRYDALQNGLDARFIGVVHAATGQGLSRSSLDADDVTSLESTADYITQSAHPYRTESARKYEFFYLHHDNYSERVRYEVSLFSGDIRLSYQVSERAIEAIRSKVIEIFNGP